MDTSAPSWRARSSFASLDDVTRTRAPQSLAIWTAAEDTPPPTPRISTSSPGRTLAWVTTMRQAVMFVRMNDAARSEEHTSELQSRLHLVCRLLLEKKKNNDNRFALDTCSLQVN